MTNKKTVCVIGPRPKDICGYTDKCDNLPIEEQYRIFTKSLEGNMYHLVTDKNVTNFISNGSQGIGQMAATAACDLNEEYTDGSIGIDILEPYTKQDTLWAEDGPFNKNDYAALCERVGKDHVHSMCSIDECSNITKAHRACYHKMVDESDALFLYWTYKDDPSEVNPKKNALIDAAHYAINSGKELIVYDWHGKYMSCVMRDTLTRPKNDDAYQEALRREMDAF